MSDASQILVAIEAGDPHAASQLLPLVYEELRRLAVQKLELEQSGEPIDATSLVHQAYLRLAGAGGDLVWNGRGHFFAAASEAMRRILIEKARQRKRLRHGGELKRQPLDDSHLAAAASDEQLLNVHEALDLLEAESPDAAAVVKLRYFVGFTIQETAEALKLSVSTVNRHWVYARAWFFQRLNNSAEGLPQS